MLSKRALLAMHEQRVRILLGFHEWLRASEFVRASVQFQSIRKPQREPTSSRQQLPRVEGYDYRRDFEPGLCVASATFSAVTCSSTGAIHSATKRWLTQWK